MRAGFLLAVLAASLPALAAAETAAPVAATAPAVLPAAAAPPAAAGPSPADQTSSARANPALAARASPDRRRCREQAARLRLFGLRRDKYLQRCRAIVRKGGEAPLR